LTVKPKELRNQGGLQKMNKRKYLLRNYESKRSKYNSQLEAAGSKEKDLLTTQQLL
jgi:hypothetical protein